MQNENILIDQLEDQLIDNPDASTTKQLNESSLDEAFQKKLNGRANQLNGKLGLTDSGPNLDSGGYSFLVTKPLLDYLYSDIGPLQRELTEWFSLGDYALVNLRHLPESCPSGLPSDIDFSAIDLHKPSKELDHLFYYALGSFANTKDTPDQIHNIVSHCQELVTRNFHKEMITLVIRYLEVFSQNPHSPSSTVLTGSLYSNYFKSLTIVYYVVVVSLYHPTAPQLITDLDELDLISSILLAIELWHTNLNPEIRVRSLLLLFWKLILAEFGDSTLLKRVDKYLVEVNDIKNKDRKLPQDVRLTCSPLEFYTFRENIMDKYPFCDNKINSHTSREDSPDTDIKNADTQLLNDFSKDIVSRQKEFMAFDSFSDSLSNFLEIPRPNKTHSIMGQLPSQTLHIATPVPSPPSTPSDFMSGGEKIRKMYHVNQGMPFVYPTDGSALPEAIHEANEIIQDAFYESYSSKRLWEERQRYMCQERGNVDQYSHLVEDSDSDNYFSDEAVEARRLNRVEKFYKNNLSKLNSLVQTLVGVIKSNKYEVSLKEIETELDPETSFSIRFSSSDPKLIEKVRNAILVKLETMRVKETTLKASSAIAILLLRWLKASHVLKYYYFSSLLFDAQFFPAFVDFLGNSMNNPALQDSVESCKDSNPYDIITTHNKVRNPTIEIPQFDFFNVCRGRGARIEAIKLINKTKISDLPSTLDENNQSIVHIKEFNENFCFILTNLLNTTNKILIKNISQRVFLFNETKPTDLLKIVLLNYINDSLKLPILKIFKKLAPYQGRKWRTLNIDIVSQIYLNLKLSLKDNWLSGKDLESDFNNSFDQEIALRSLLQFYNVRNYPQQMKSLGYSIATTSFPVREKYA